MSLAVRKEVPLTWFDVKPIGTGKSGKPTRNLLFAYRKPAVEAVELDKRKP